MKLYVMKDYDAMSRKAAHLIAAEIMTHPDMVLGLATGSTPIGTYKRLVELYKAGDLDFSAVTTVNLDEYEGLPATHDQSYRYFMEDNLFNHVNLDKAKTNLPDGMAKDIDAECKRYEDLIASLGYPRLQLLGLGHNGHIGFNEPSDSFKAVVHNVTLTDRTIEANKRFFASKEEVPTRALTMGCGTIMKAKKVLMVVSGEDKRDALNKTVNGPITPEVPASILQLHPDVTIVCDEAAAP